MMIMITAVVIVLGRWRFIKLQLLSTEVEFLIWSATSFVGGGGREALHMLGAEWSLIVSLLIAFLGKVEPQVCTFSFR